MTNSAIGSLFSEGGECGRLMAAKNWTDTPLGPVEQWPQSLRSALSICLASPYPIAIYWGNELALLYNDAWSPILGSKHPLAMGRAGREVWPEIWNLIGPQFERTLSGGEPTRQADGLLPMQRHGYLEECYFDYSFSPIRGEGGHIGGVFNAVIETTYRVINERRTRLLQTIAERFIHTASEEDVYRLAAEAMATNPEDLPFTLLYRTARDRSDTLQMVASSGIPAGRGDELREVSEKAGPWHLDTDAAASGISLANALPDSLRAGIGPWPESPQTAVVLPLILPDQGRVGLLVAGISARRALDAEYRSFLGATAERITKALMGARAIEQAREKAEALAAIDLAKTAFFSNVSHEFRTPLTLMLGPLEDSLSDHGQPLPPRQRERQELLHRNALRLLRLVNTLLDVSRIEAGRAQASFEPMDLSSYTVDLASTFRSAIERANMQLVVDCPPLSQPVFVDRDMWEKIVLNLLSNAFKHTFSGAITVSLRESAGQAELRVIDTGIGIPADQIPRLFERFHRVQGAQARTHEGSGIGLALAQDLVKLHGGSIHVESKVDRGSIFQVTIPLGASHLPAEQTDPARIRTTTPVGANAFVEEALSWLPEGAEAGHQSEGFPASTCEHFERNVDDDQPEVEADRTVRILLADDNADMRRHVRKILNRRWAVDAVADGAAALVAARAHAPDLILSDVMMPKLDGFGLLRELRADPALRHISVILLSARAGEEASIEGLKAGADDYLIKPFSAQELLARVAAHLGLARMRRDSGEKLRESEDRYRGIVNQSVGGIAETDTSGRFITVNEYFCAIVGYSREELLTLRIQDITHPDDLPRNLELVERLAINSTPFEIEKRYVRKEGSIVWVHNGVSAIRDANGQIRSLIRIATDISERKRSEQLLRYRTAQFETLVNQTPLGVYLVDADFRIREVNPIATPVFGDIQGGVIGRDFDEIIHILWEKEYADEIVQIFRHTLETGESYVAPERAKFRIDRGITEYYEWRLDPITVPDGRRGVVCYFRDISQAVEARLKIQESEERFRQMADHAPVMVWVTAVDGTTTFMSRSWYEFTGQTLEMGHGFGWLDAIHPADLAAVKAAFLSANEKQEPFRLEYRLRHKDGDYRWAIDSATPRLDPHGNFVGYIGSVLDITERKQSEIDLAERNRDLKRANTELEHFASIASHDLQQPLRMISTYCDILGKRYASSFDEKAKEYFARIIAGSQRMRELIHALLSYSQVDKQPLNVNEIPARAVIDDALEHLLPEITVKRARVSLGVLPTIVGDRARLTQLAQNLIANALKFSVAERAPIVSITAIDDGEWWQFSVSDNGIGIPAAEQEKIFHIFQRLHAVDVYPGSGIGLATCKKIVEQHGGRIWVESEPGVGSTFCFTIPKRQTDSQDQS